MILKDKVFKAFNPVAWRKKHLFYDERNQNLSQEKINFINNTYQKELQYWKKVALKKALTKNETKELIDLAPSGVFLIHKAAIKNATRMNIHEIIFYLKSRFPTDNRNQITFIQDIPSQGDIPSFEAISEDQKTFSKPMKEDENIEYVSLKNNFLFGLGSTTFIIDVKLLSLTFLKNKGIIQLKLFIKYKRLRVKSPFELEF